MLQQTTVAAVLPYFERWMIRFPTVEALAEASSEEALALWQGLGYYRRCEALRKGAQQVVARGWPNSAEEWRTLPGIGPYTAAAIASIASGEAVPVVDGNVRRVLSRLLASERTGGEAERWAWRAAEALLVRERAGDWNQALMELGATVCRPKDPRCGECPLRGACRAAATGAPDAFPVRVPKGRPIEERHVAWVAACAGRTAVRRIPPGRWWEGLWEFPRAVLGPDEKPENREPPFAAVQGVYSLGPLSHVVTRHRVRLHGFAVWADHQDAEWKWVTPDELAELPMPSPQRRLWERAAGPLGFGEAVKAPRGRRR